jgi:hypothetical protein
MKKIIKHNPMTDRLIVRRGYLRLKASMNCLRQRLKKNCSMNSKEEQIVLSSMQTAMFVHTFGHVEIML